MKSLKQPKKQERITCYYCINAKLVQFHRGNIKDPVLCECQLKEESERKNREVARYHTCCSAIKAAIQHPITPIVR